MVNHHRSVPFVIEGDEPQPLLGSDKATSPVELLLTALTHCVGTTLSYHAALHDVALNRVEIDASGRIDLSGFLDISQSVRAGLSEVELSFIIESDTPRSKIEELIGIAIKHSPVSDTVSHETRVVGSLTEVPTS